MLNTVATQDIVTTQEELKILAKRLDESGNAIAASHLRNLHAALGGHPSFEDWAAIDLQRVINPEAIAAGIKSRATPGQLVRICDWLRNGLILVPVFLTWLGIWQASSMYGALLSKDTTQASYSFLYLWQQGFNHTLPEPFILSNLAWIDCSLLFLILILTLFTTWTYNLKNMQTEKDAEQLRERLALTLGDASLCLVMMERQRRQNQPSNLADIARFLSDFARQFQHTNQEFLAELAEERKRRGDLNAFAARLEAMVQNMVSTSHVMQQTNAELTTAIRAVLVPVKEIPGLVTAAAQAVSQLNSMANSLGQFVGDQNRWRQELQNVLATGLGQLTADQKKATQELHTLLGGSLQQLNALLGQQLTEQQRHGQELQHILAVKLGAIATSLDQLVQKQQSLAHSLTDAADTLETTGLALAQVIKGLENASQEQVKILTATQFQQATQQDLTYQMAQVLKSVHEAGPELRSMSVDIDNFVRALRDIPNSLKAQLLDPLSHYASAAANVAMGSGTLEKAAQHLEHVTNKLDGRLGP